LNPGCDGDHDRQSNPVMSNYAILNEWSNRALLLLLSGALAWLFGSTLLAFQGLWMQAIGVPPTILLMLFMPGFLIMRALNVRGLGSVRSIFYALLLSILFDYLLFGSADVLLWISGIKIFEPLLLIIICGIGNIVLFALGGRNDSGHVPVIELKEFVNPSSLILISMPLLAVLSTQLLNSYHNSAIQISLIIMVAITASIILFKANERKIPLAIFSISFTLLLQTGLVGNYLVEWADLFFEFWIPNSAIISGNWDPSIALITNPMLSLAILPSVFSVMSGLELIWFFKVMFPFILSFLPLGLYCVFRTQAGARMAFVSVLLVIFSSYFYISLLGLNRQSVASIFLVGAILVILDQSMKDRYRAPFLTCFLMGVVLSHYGMAFIALFAMGGALILSLLMKLFLKGGTSSTSEYWLIRHPGKLALSISIASLLLVLWYSLTAGGVIIHEYESIFRSLFVEISGFASQISPLIALDAQNPLLYLDVKPYINIFYLIFIALGLAGFLFHGLFRLVRLDYYLLSIPFFILFLMGYGIIGATGFVEEGRFLFTTSMVLAVMAVSAIKGVEEAASKLFKFKWKKVTEMATILFAILLVISTSGVLLVFASVPSSTNIEPWNERRPSFTYPEVRAEKWMVAHTGTYMNISQDAYPVWADSFNAYLTVANQGVFLTLRGNGTGVVSEIEPGSWVFIGRTNLLTGRLLVDDPNAPERLFVNWLWMNNLNFTQSLVGYSMVYNNGFSQIYYNI